MKNFSDHAISEFFAVNSGDPFLTLLKISHDSFSDIFLVNNTENIVSNGNTYQAFPFTIILPSDDGESVPTAKIELDNINLDFITELRTITSPASVTISSVMASDPDYIEIEYSDILLRSVSVNSKKITGSLSFDDLFSVNLTSETYGPSNFPGIFN